MSYRTTKSRFCLLGAGLLLWATPAAAQQLPFTLPANTVVGRTSIGPGEASAIPFAQLVSSLSSFGLVIGPGSSTVGHLAIWNNPTGGALADFSGTPSGILYFTTGGGIGSSAACANNQALMGNTGAAPGCRALLGADLPSIANANLAQAGAATLKGNPTGSTANVQDFTISGLPAASACGATDVLVKLDVATGTFEKVTCNQIATAATSGVPTVNGQAGPIVGVDTNTLNAKTANYTIASTDCGSTIQAGAGSTGLFTITLPAVAGFSGVCTVNVKNGDTARGKVLSGFPADINPILWPSQSVTVKIINGVWATTTNPGLWIPTAAVTFHVNSTTPGSDTNNDCLGTGTGACATANHAMSLISSYIDNLNGISIQWDTGTTANFTALPYVGPGTITLNGNSQLINVSSAPGSILLIGQPTAPVYGNWIIEKSLVCSRTRPPGFLVSSANTEHIARSAAACCLSTEQAAVSHPAALFRPASAQILFVLPGLPCRAILPPSWRRMTLEE
jgi:hypothetical protein